MIYFDNAATSLIKPPGVNRAVIDAMRNCGGAGRGGHAQAAYSADILFDCRVAAAELLGAGSPEDIVFTFNATHALNIAIASVMDPLLRDKRGARVLISGYEHNSVLRPLVDMERLGVKTVPVFAPPFEPEFFIHKLEREMDLGVDAVVCTHVSNVFGYILPIERVDQLCYDRGVPLVIDASQSAGCLDIDISKYRAANFICMPGHKGLLGPQGTGILVCNNSYTKPVLSGGTGSDSRSTRMPDYLPDRLEAGTHNAHGIAGLAEGIKYVLAKGTDSILSHERKVISHVISEISGMPFLRVFTVKNMFCQTGVLSVAFRGISCEEVSERLADRGIAVRAGLHCSPLAHQSAETDRDGTLRVSSSVYNKVSDAGKFATELGKIVDRTK